MLYTHIFLYIYVYSSTRSHAALFIWLIRMYMSEYDIERQMFAKLDFGLINPGNQISLIGYWEGSVEVVSFEVLIDFNEEYLTIMLRRDRLEV